MLAGTAVTAVENSDPAMASASGPRARWVHQLGTAANTGANATATDQANNIVVVGITAGRLPGSPDAWLGGSDVFIAKYNRGGAKLWNRQFGTSAEDVALGVATDGAGNIFVSGSTNSTLPGSPVANAGSYDAFLAKFDSAGNQLWLRQLGSTGYDAAFAIALDSSGSAYIAGPAGGALSGSLDSFAGGTTDSFLAKYDTAGNRIWVHLLGTTHDDYATGVSVDGTGNPFVSGSTDGQLPGSAEANVGNRDAFVARYNSSGTIQWVHQLGSNMYDTGAALATDSAGNSYVTGITDGRIVGSPTANAGGFDVYVARYNANGQRAWVQQFGSASDEHGSGVAVDRAGNVYVSGDTNGTLPGSQEANAGGSDAYVAKFDSHGSRQWTHQIGSAGIDLSTAVATDKTGLVYSVGSTNGTLPGSVELNSGFNDAFIWRLDTVAFGNGPAYTAPTRAKAVVGDFNGDGYDDIYWYVAGKGHDTLWYGSAVGFVNYAHPQQVNGIYTPVVGDFNADGHVDILWYAPGKGRDSLWQANNMAGLPQFAAKPVGQINGTYTPIVGDFNGDMHTDIIWYAPGPGHDSVWNGATSSTGDTAFSHGPHININGTYTPVTGDFNGDHKSDILWYAPGPKHDYFWTATGSGFVNGSPIKINGTYTAVSGDFSGDGKTDILWYAPGPKSDYIWEATGSGFVNGPPININGTSYIAAVGDFNADGHADIVWYTPTNGRSPTWNGI